MILALAAILTASVTTEAVSAVVISEFMALNTATLTDEDGTHSDWVEVYNSSTNTVNLAGWYLTGNSSNLTQWQFPATNLAPHQFLVVFASDKNRRIPGAPLHTNFKLGGSGEYLALVLPDGVTKASEFAPTYPQQYADISYGYVMTGAVTTIVAPNATARALVPATDIGAGWQLTGFDDSAWASGTLGAGYDTSGSYASAIGLNLQTAMLNVNASAYTRVPFAVAGPGGFQSLTLSLRYDDGCIAYLNGAEVLRRNAPSSPAWDSSATAAHGAPYAGLLVENFEGSSTNFTLSQYAASPAPAVQPAGANSTGKFLRLLYDGTNGSANGVTFRQTAPGRFQTIVADFDFRITSAVNGPADGFCFLLIPTALHGTIGPGVNIPLQAAEEPNYPGTFAIGFDVYPHNARNDVSAHWNGAEAVNVTIPTATIDLAAGVFHHAKVRLEHVTGGALVTLTLTRNINGTPGAPYSPITNLFIGGLNPFDCRVQFGGRTGGLNLGLDLDNCNVQFLPPQGPIAFEDFDITPSVSQLVPGQNMLAIHGLNVSSGSSNFLVQARLVGRDLVLTEPSTYLYPPTPGTWNESAGASVLPPPVTFSPPAGVYASNSIAVTLACSSSSATIRYTLDGSTPGASSPVYTNTILLFTNATLRARAGLGGVPSQVTAANYVLLDSSVTNFSSNLPLVIIDTLRQPIPDGSKIAAYAVFIDTNTPPARTRLTGSNDYIGQLGIELHGSSSLGFPKKTYAIELDDESGKALDYELLGLPAGSDWLLYPSYDDKTLMNNVLTHELFGAMGHYAIRCKYTELFLRTAPGKLTAGDYQGIYVLMERIRVEPNRVDLATLDPTDSAPPAVTGGYLFSKDKINSNEDLTFTTSSGAELIALYPKADKITQPQLDYLTGYLNDFEAALYGANWRDPLNGYAGFMDVSTFVDFHWMVEYPKNIDGVRISNYMQKDRNDKLKAGPIWDWDLSWGNADYAQGGKTNGWYYPLMGDGDDLWLRKLRSDPDFYQRIIDRWGALRLKVFNPTNIFARVDQITNHLWEAQAREFAAWPRLGTYVWPNPNGAAGGWDVDYVTPTTYSGIIEQFKHFVLGRYLWIEQQFLPAPTLETNGGTLTMSAPFGTIHYTLDGTDPRAAGGGLSPSARLFNGAVTLTNNAAIFARAFHTNAWSASAQAVYVVELPSLRITEINHHPAPPPSDGSYDRKDFEFIEVRNTGAKVIDLAGTSLGGGINFTFAPNALVPAGAATSNNFDGGGTPLAASTLGQPPGGALVNDGTGILLRLLNSGTNTARNRVTFNQSANGSYDRVVADFDFRTTNSAPAAVSGTPTRQNFDIAGTAYTLGQGGPTAPVVHAADAGSTGNYLRLVPASAGQLGTIAFNRSAAGAFNSVVATFDFRITPPSGANQADGMSVALLNTSVYGANGAGPNFGDGPNLTSSIGVSFDDYNNGPNPAEPNNNHVSLHWNNAQIGNAVTPSFDMSNGKFHRAQVIVWFSGGNAYVTVRLTPNINGVPGQTETVLANALIPGAAAYQSRAAFGARTGGQWAAHDLDNVNVEYTANAAAAAGLSLLLLPATQFGASGPGTTLANFTDWPRVTNALALDLAFNPSNLFNDVSLYWNAALAINVSLPTSTLDLDDGVFHHARLQLDAASGGVYAAATLVPDSLGTPGAPINVFSNQFIPGAVLGNNRLEFAGRNGGLVTKVDLDNTLASFDAFSPMLLNPGESIIVVRNLAAFISRYGNLIRVAGEYSGSLANEGEHLTLLGPLGEPILDFNYDPDWYPSTDGGGYSLVVVDPDASISAWGSAQNWRPSGEPGGSPGTVEPVLPVTLMLAPTADGDTLSLAWPAHAGDYDLFSAAALSPPVEWLRVTDTPALSNLHWIVTLNPPTAGARYYRLQSR